MTDTLPARFTKLAEALAERHGEAQAAKISTDQMLAALKLMGVANPEAELRQALRCLNHRPDSGLQA